MEEHNSFANIEVFSGLDQPDESMALTNPVGQTTAIANVEQARAVAEVQAAMVVARMNPRDERKAYMRIIQACKRKSLADSSMYAYKRGATLVTGPSIRLAEVLARSWGNTTYGMRELSRKSGESECEAFAWDLETNTRVTRQFQVRHLRDAGGGTKELTSERDIYELIANMAQRRVRACILELIPGDVVEAAQEECKKTIAKGDGKPLEDQIRDMLVAFSEYGVSQEDIEGFLGHKISSTVPAEIVRLKTVFRSLRDGMADREHFFKNGGPAPEPPADGKNSKAEQPPAPQEEQVGKPRVFLDCPKSGSKKAIEVCLSKKCGVSDCSALAEYNEANKE